MNRDSPCKKNRFLKSVFFYMGDESQSEQQQKNRLKEQKCKQYKSHLYVALIFLR